MREHEPPISLGLNARPENPPPPESLQFTRAEPAGAGVANRPRCLACKSPLVETYFHAHGRQVCPTCAQRIESHQQAPPAHSLLKAALYGGGAALAGCIIFATVEIVTGWQIGLLAILVGYMVGRAIRHASQGLGGRSQQILAVLLTYFAISFSYVGVAISQVVKTNAAKQTAAATAPPTVQPVQDQKHQKASVGSLLLLLAWLGLAAPFLSLANPMNLISLFIIFIGLRQAWVLTGRSDIVITGPYQVSSLVT
ncbi:MAG TPA: hypothetical protein VH325_16720 [Bryobacteraceae bacterium]|jgi:hypothetical protein|nr:hypothetical protein [Bryobacteraceae bacterium]